MLETWIIKKWFVHPEEIYAKLKATEGKKAPKSKWQQRLEEAQRMQQQQLKEQQKKRR
jgi:YidC/Oxa1 family membrane protein insertase